MKKEEKAVVSTTAVTEYQSNQTAMSIPSQFKSVKRLTKDVTSITRLGEAIIQCQSELYQMEMSDPAAPGEKRGVLVVDVFDCVRNEEFALICGAVLSSSLIRLNKPITNLYFAIRAGEIAPGKRYRKVDVVQLERVE
jgi:hypothetical protein